MWSRLFEEDTVYASGYSALAWRKVRKGMSLEDVTSRLGEPLTRGSRQDATISMQWSRSPADTHYRCRVLIFEQGVVVRKHSEFYVD